MWNMMKWIMSKGSSGHFFVACLLGGLIGFVCAGKLEDLVEKREDSLRKLHVKFETVYNEEGCDVLETCPKTLPACGTLPFRTLEDDNKYAVDSGWRCDSIAKCHPSDRLCNEIKVNVKHPDIKLPPGYDNNDPELARFICASTRLDRTFEEIWAGGKVGGWLFVGSATGSQVSFPGKYRGRKYPDCLPYDSRTRPWYITGSSIPKDVVLLLDISTSMAGSRLELMKTAVRQLLGTLAPTSYVGLVTFSSRAEMFCLNSDCVLSKATESNVGKLYNYLDSLTAGGNTSMSQGFQVAFEKLLFSRTVKYADNSDSGSTGCNRIIMLFTDGYSTEPDCSGNETESNADGCGLEQVTNVIRDGQDKFAALGYAKAAIFTFSVGSDAQKQLPKAIACRNTGAWNTIEEDQDPLSSMNSYFQYMAMSLDANYTNTTLVRWSNPYVDASGLGTVVTVTKPVISKVNGKTRLVGVAGIEVNLQELLDAADEGDESSVKDVIYNKNKGGKCFVASPTWCDMQIIRGENEQCTDAETLTAGESYDQCRGKSQYAHPICSFGESIKDVQDTLSERFGEGTTIGENNPEITLNELRCCDKCYLSEPLGPPPSNDLHPNQDMLTPELGAWTVFCIVTLCWCCFVSTVVVCIDCLTTRFSREQKVANWT